MRNDRGQILLMIILLVALGVSVTVASVSRSTVDVRMTKQIEESQQALKAAEAGIEKALLSGASSIQTDLDTSSAPVTYTTTVTLTGGPGQYDLPAYYAPGDTANVWLSNHVGSSISTEEEQSYTGNTLDICWTDTSGLHPAVAVSVYYYDQTAGSYKFYSGAYDTEQASRSNNFLAATTPCSSDSDYAKMFTLNLVTIGAGGDTNTPLLLRLRPVYAGTRFTVFPVGDDLPDQGKLIESVGETDSGISRKILVQQEYAVPPMIFDTVLWSKSSI